MKIRSIRLDNHPGVGNLSVSFLDSDGTPYDVIVLAGANGTGKSALLEAIYWAMSPQMDQRIGLVDIELQLSENEIATISGVTGPIGGPPFPQGVVRLQYDSQVAGNWDQAFRFKWQTQNGEQLGSGAAIHSPVVQSVLRCFFNEASVDYNAGAPNSITSLSLDDGATKTTRSSGIAREISQLLVDIRNSDSEDVNIWVEQNQGQPVPIEVQDQRFGRFRAAFTIMWPAKKFRRIRRDGQSMYVEFEEFGRISTIDRLSTGEKQIAFRGGYLLRNRERIGNSVILVDEPELSLHPDWQRGVVGFYREIVKQADGTHPQIVIATHSPFIVHGAPGAKVIILEKNAATGVISESPTPTYPVSLESMAIRAFSLERFIAAAAQQTLILTEGESDAELLRTAWEKLRQGLPMPFEIRAALGAKNINITLNDSELGSKLGNRKLIGIFDFDDAGYSQWKGAWKNVNHVGNETAGLSKKHQTLAAWTMLLPVPAHRNTLASLQLGSRSMMPIELLFADADLPAAMTSQKLVAGGGQIPFVPDGHKTAFAAAVANYNAASFAAFEPLLQSIEAIVAQV